MKLGDPTTYKYAFFLVLVLGLLLDALRISGRTLITDVCLSTFILASMYCWQHCTQKRRLLFLYLFDVSIGVAWLIKEPVVLLFIRVYLVNYKLVFKTKLRVTPLATLGTRFLKEDKRGVWQFIKGFVVHEGVTYGLKMSINKTRPDPSNKNSFPSGHTSTVFHSAVYIQKRYGFKYSIPACASAGCTAASRVDSKMHDILAIITGATLGLGSNLLFTTEYQQKPMELSTSSFEGKHRLGYRYKF